MLRNNQENKNRRRLAIVILIILCLLSFLVGFYFVNWLRERANANTVGTGNRYNFASYNTCNYNGTFCPDGTNLQLWYDANNNLSYPGSGQTVYDLSGNSRNAFFGKDATANAFDPTYNATGVKSFILDGDNDFLETSLPSNFSTNMSWEIWFKRANNLDTGGNSIQQRLINNYRTGQTSGQLMLGVQGQTIQARGQGAANIDYNTGYIPNTEWQHALLTYDSATGQGRAYVNSALHNTFTQTLSAASTGNIKIGILDELLGTLAARRAFNGQIAIVRIYNKVLTQTEITQNFNVEKSRFGFVENNILLDSATSLAFNSTQVSAQPQNLQLNLNNFQILDRRNSFTPYSVSISSTNFTKGADTISKNKLNFVVTGNTKNTGSGLYNSFSSGGNLATNQTLLTNSTVNGGGKFLVNMQLQLEIPAFSESGNYNGTLIFSVI